MKTKIHINNQICYDGFLGVCVCVCVCVYFGDALY
jgi:hypothetical protein